MNTDIKQTSKSDNYSEFDEDREMTEDFDLYDTSSVKNDKKQD